MCSMWACLTFQTKQNDKIIEHWKKTSQNVLKINRFHPNSFWLYHHHLTDYIIVFLYYFFSTLSVLGSCFYNVRKWKVFLLSPYVHKIDTSSHGHEQFREYANEIAYFVSIIAIYTAPDVYFNRFLSLHLHSPFQIAVSFESRTV